MKITRLKVTEAAAAQLDALGLSLADLVCIIYFARKSQDDIAQIYRLDVEQVPADIRAEVQHLAGVELHVVSRAIISAMRPAMNETGGRGSPPSADCKGKRGKL